MKIGFIGAGKVGFSLGKYFTVNNINVTGYYSNSIKSAKEAVKFTNSRYFESIEKLIEESDTIFITTPDGVIEDIWNSINKLCIKDKIICHCSGSLSSKIFSNIDQKQAYAYSIHPMFAFSDKYNSHIKLKEATITIEGDEKYKEYFISLFKSCGNKVKDISWENKTKYHIASVAVSNHVIALVDLASKLLEECGFSKEEAINSLYPLMLNNINNIGKYGLVNSLTGPIERDDIGTVNNHLQAINKEDRELYRILSKKLIDIAKIKNIDKNYIKLEKMMGD